jgi:hypothetical protein
MDGTAAFLDELDEPVGRVQSQLHPGSVGEHTFGGNSRVSTQQPRPQGL